VFKIYNIRAIIAWVCLPAILVGCAVTPSPVPTMKPNLSPLQVQSPVATPAPGGAASKCPEGCIEASPDCVIKGTVTGMGDKFYYTPDMPGYKRALVLVMYGARWFCTVDEAVRQGWKQAPPQ
jgi:hypothetical protein